MIERKGLVSVIIPTYNRADLIVRSVKSVLNQTYKKIELIIVDDGSTDNTEDVVNSLNDERVIYIKQSNQGACVARNNGIDHAKGEFIAFQDSDDVWHENKLELQLEALNTYGADVVVCKNQHCVNGKSRRGKTIHKAGFISKDMPPIWIGTQTIFAKAKVIKENRFDPRVQRWQDFELLVRIQKNNTIFFLEKNLVDYYLQKDSITRTSQDKLLNAWKIIFEKNPDIQIQYKKNAGLIADTILSETYSVTDKIVEKQLKYLAFSFDKSFNVRFKFFIGKIKYLIKKKIKQLVNYN